MFLPTTKAAGQSNRKTSEVPNQRRTTGILAPSTPFMPFGPLPGIGSHFYIGSPEVFAKNWSSVDLYLNWQDRPSDLKKHYGAYADDYLYNNGQIKDNISAAL